ncbi:hypothetical protein AYI69_g7649 [Smittium culicis]|uniref:Uncharacterized protein n=1 Tax=Smittium culicis TaxID=133412 RepID=A0A1R1XQN5_9FUNG|nr:hypothetical protein AYI69_g7649 [Smittium culicis]
MKSSIDVLESFGLSEQNSDSKEKNTNRTHDVADSLNPQTFFIASHIGVLVTFPNSEKTLIALPGSCFTKEVSEGGILFWKINAKVSVCLPISSGEIGAVSLTIVRLVTDTNINTKEKLVDSQFENENLSYLSIDESTSSLRRAFNIESSEQLIQIVDITEKPYSVKLAPKILRPLAY